MSVSSCIGWKQRIDAENAPEMLLSVLHKSIRTEKSNIVPKRQKTMNVNTESFRFHQAAETA